MLLDNKVMMKLLMIIIELKENTCIFFCKLVQLRSYSSRFLSLTIILPSLNFKSLKCIVSFLIIVKHILVLSEVRYYTGTQSCKQQERKKSNTIIMFVLFFNKFHLVYQEGNTYLDATYFLSGPVTSHH